jgi:predicted transcriptional regulator
MLRAARSKADITQVELAHLTGIPQRHISEMEYGKRHGPEVGIHSS